MLKTLKHRSLLAEVTRFIINFLVRFMLAGVVTYACWLAIIYYNYWFSWHVILCTLGMIPLMTEAFLLFAPDELWSAQLSRRQKYWIHGYLMIAGTLLVTVGCIITFYYISEGFHLISVHGITGLVSMILFIKSLLLGVCATYSQHLKIKPVIFKAVHNGLGILAFVIGVVSLCCSYYTNWFVFYTSYESRLAAVIATVLACSWTLNVALVSFFNQINTILGRS